MSIYANPEIKNSTKSESPKNTTVELHHLLLVAESTLVHIDLELCPYAPIFREYAKLHYRHNN